MSRFSFFFAIFAVWLVGATASAQQYPDLQRPALVADTGTEDVAIVVAVEDYLLLPDVPGAARNAADWETFFRESLGIEDVRLLVDDQATREDILAVTKAASATAPAGARLWFVFIGHGAPTSDGTDGMLIGMDAKGTARSLDARGVRRAELLAHLQGSAAEPVVVLDACFSGRDTRGDSLVPGVQPVLSPRAMAVAKSAVVFSAAGADQFAGDLPGADRPAFSYLLLGALRGWGDVDSDGNVTADEAHRWVSRQFHAITERTQTPEIAGTEEVVLTWKVKEEAPDISRIVSRQTREPDRVSVDDGTCPPGKTMDATTGEHCCWPGQAWNGSACVGRPTRCLAGFEPIGERCERIACEGGRVRAADGIHCCWPGQGYSRHEERCIGKPQRCPGSKRAFSTPASVAGEGCFEPQTVSVATRVTGATVFANGMELGHTDEDGSLTMQLPRRDYVVSVEADGKVVAQRTCKPEDCILDLTRQRRFAIMVNPLGLIMPWGNLASARLGVGNATIEVGPDAGLVAVDSAVLRWWGGSAGVTYSLGTGPWNGGFVGLASGFRGVELTEGGKSTAWYLGPTLGIRHLFASGVTFESYAGAKLRNISGAGPAFALDFAMALGYAF